MAKSNLIPNTERSPEELREMGRNGSIKSVATRCLMRLIDYFNTGYHTTPGGVALNNFLGGELCGGGSFHTGPKIQIFCD